MNDLMHLQEQFQNFLLSRQSDISEAIVTTEQVSAVGRLAIYQDAYQSRLIESLNVSFPAVHLYLGTEEFQQLCREYINKNPSTFRSIRWYGATLAEFIKNYYDKPYAYMAELADFEWKMTLAFDAADDTLVCIEDMAVVPPAAWAQMQFRLHPSVQQLEYFWNVIPVWQTLIHDEELPAWQNQPKPMSWLLWRAPDYIIQFYSLTEEEAYALIALQQGASFGAMCEGLCQWTPVEEVGMKAASYLKNWIQKGIIAQLILSPQ